jgi:hypothetical protein
MAVTGKQIFDAALVLMDEVTETGNVVTENPDYYKVKALNILTTLQAELLPLSSTPVPITDLSQNLLVSDRTALLVLPYGLAAHLLLADDMNLASFLNARYDELKRKMATGGITPIKDVYWGGEDNGTA